MDRKRNIGIDGLKIAGEERPRGNVALPKRKIGLPTTRQEEKAYKTSAKLTRKEDTRFSDMEFNTFGGNVKPLVAKKPETDEISRTLSDIYSEEQNTEEKPRKKHNKKDKKPKRKKKIVMTIVLFFVFLLAAGGGILFFIGNDFISKVTGGGSLISVLMDPGEPLQKDERGLTSVLLYGTEGYDMDNPEWDGGQLTDSIMILTFDQETGVTFLTSLPRDLKTQKRCTSTGKLNEVYWCTYSKNAGTEASREAYEKQAGENFIQVAEEITGLKIQYYVHVNWSALVGVVEAIDGIDVAIEYQGDVDKYTGDLPVIWTTDKRGIKDLDGVNWKNGTVQHLDGLLTLALARSRSAFGGGESYGSNGNWSREQHQQTVIKAIVDKAKRTNFITDLGAAFSLKDSIGDGIRMSFKDTELKTLFRVAKDMDMDKINSIKLIDYENNVYLFKVGSLPLGNCTGDGCQMASYVFPNGGTYNYTEIHKYIADKIDEVLNPPVEEHKCGAEDGSDGSTGAEKAENTATKC
jgi:LCP family protein required for cell wall assembly